MWLFQHNIFVKQILPPHWRGTYKEKIIAVLTYPIQTLYENIYGQRSTFLANININAQVGVLEAWLNRKYAQSGYKHIEIIDGDNAGEIEVLINKTYWDHRPNIQQDIKTVLPWGFKATLTMKRIHTQTI